MLDREEVEALADGSYDISTTWEDIKAEGNAWFAKKEYKKAFEKYELALRSAPHGQVHFLHGNRATCLFHLKEFRDALDEINKALECMPTWDKGLYRKQCIVQAIAKEKAKQLNIPLGSVYADKAHVISDANPTKESTLLWRRLINSLDSANQDVLDGVFARLTNDMEFRRVMYPGLTIDDITKKNLPRSLKQLLEDPWYEQEMIDLMPKVQAKATSVLENVKRKAAAQGEFMDAATETALRPQVLREAFGREVLAMIQRVAVAKHAVLAQDTRCIADPHAERATWDILGSSTLDSLFNTGVGIQDAFLGEDFIPLLKSDVARMWKQNQLVETADRTFMRFVSIEDTSESFPALAEILDKLLSIPYEINLKRQSQLCAEESIAGATSVVAFPRGVGQPLRLDCGTDAATDNGYRLSCLYAVQSTNDQIVHLQRATKQASKSEEHVEVVSDRLVLFKSQEVLHELTSNTGDDNLFYVVFRIHGRL
ncbi:hypothetical protein AeMF1_017584 [Aphanomyces euteiches]|nr:hypothetical protein AeMF1_017584 [Aphanomyces euteiches]